MENYYPNTINQQSSAPGRNYLSSSFHALFIVSSFLYLTRLGFSPVYLIPVLLCLGAVLLTGRCDARAALLTLGLSVFLLVHTMAHNMHGATVNSLVLACTLPLISMVERSPVTPSLLSGIRKGYSWALLFFTVEAVIRLANPTAPSAEEFDFHAGSDSTWFYLYKYGSIAFVDSNLTSVALLMLLGLGLCLRLRGVLPKRHLALNYFLLLLCFSRAAAIGVLISLFLGPLKRYKILATAVCSVMVVAGYFLVAEDASFGTKFVIYAGFLEAFSSFSTFDVLLGKGFGWFLERFGMASHSIFVQSMVEGGVIYSILFVVVMRFAGAFKNEGACIRFLMVFVPSLSASIYVMTLCWVVTTVYGNVLLKDGHRD